MDGVLIDSEPVWQEVIEQILAGLGIALTPEMRAHTLGMGNDESMRYVLGLHPRVKADVTEVSRRINDTVLQRIAEGIGRISGATELVRELAGRDVPLALVSTSAPALMQAVIRAQRLKGIFRVVLSSEAVGPGKPDPAVYREAVRQLQADPSRSVAIEDTPNGARSAHGAGLRVISFTNDSAVIAKVRDVAWQVAGDFTVVRRLVFSTLGLS